MLPPGVLLEADGQPKHVSHPDRKPEKRPDQVIQGLVFHHRSRPKPSNAGRANSSPMVVIRVPQSMPDGDSRSRRPASGSHTSPVPHTRHRIGKSRWALGGCGRSSRPSARQEIQVKQEDHEAGTSARRSLYTGPIPHVNYPAARFEKFFTKSVTPGRAARCSHRAVPSRPGRRSVICEPGCGTPTDRVRNQSKNMMARMSVFEHRPEICH